MIDIRQFENPWTMTDQQIAEQEKWCEDVRALCGETDGWVTEWLASAQHVLEQAIEIAQDDHDLAVYQGRMGIVFLALEFFIETHKPSQPKHRLKVRRILSTGEIIRTPYENEYSYRRRVAMLTKPNTMTRGDWNECMEYFKHSCAVCGRPRGLFHTIAKDHWIPISDPTSPGTVPWNIIPLCHGAGGCNNSKGSRNPHDWLISVYGLKRAREIEERITEYLALVHSKSTEL